MPPSWLHPNIGVLPGVIVAVFIEFTAKITHPYLGPFRANISWPLAEIMNLSVLNGVFPSRLQRAKIIPIYKDNDVFEPKNYRPISLLSNFSKIFEKLMYKRLKIFFEKKLVLYEKQYGFRDK